MIPPAMPDPNTQQVDAVGDDSSEPRNWRNELRTAFRSASELCRHLDLQNSPLMPNADDSSDFPVLVPRHFAARMRRGDPNDPLLRQVFADRIEKTQSPGFSADPLDERQFSAGGVLRKYAGRALLITTAACPVHCRYCFRRHFPYSDQLAARNRWSGALEQLRKSPDIHEVILSGGDPLSLATSRLAELLCALEEIPTLSTVRIHTRFPTVLSSRVTPALLAMLGETRLKTVVVLHCNHENELAGADVAEALTHLRMAVDVLLNQSVLLRGVNDSVDTLTGLSSALLRSGVLPYYLHLLDPVSGSAHFDVAADEAKFLVAQMRKELPGYLVPRLVREQPGALSKTPVE